MKPYGKFIAFEGCEGVGKSTQLLLLKDYLERTGQQAVFTREPGGTPLAEKIRAIILGEKIPAETEALLFAAARADHIVSVIMPALCDGKIVVCDRFLDSSLAYQAYARNLGEERVLNFNAFAVENCMPDVTLFIDQNPLESFRRQKGKTVENDRMECEPDAFHLAVYDGFKVLADKYARFECVVPEEQKPATNAKIVAALIKRGVIR